MAWKREPSPIPPVVPQQDTEIAQLYWSTDIPVREIAETYGVANPQKLNEVAGLGNLVGCACRRCSGPLSVRSRQDAKDKYYTAWTGKPGLRSWADLCAACAAFVRDWNEAQQRARWEAEQRRRFELRTMPYREYLQTPEWAERRAVALKRAKYRCQICASGARLNVHHRTYARRGDERPHDLTVLCESCRLTFHERGQLAEEGVAD